MSWRAFGNDLEAAWRAVRWRRLAVILLAALAAGVASDWLRRDRVLLPAPLPTFTTVEPAK